MLAVHDDQFLEIIAVHTARVDRVLTNNPKKDVHKPVSQNEEKYQENDGVHRVDVYDRRYHSGAPTITSDDLEKGEHGGIYITWREAKM